MNTSHVDDRPRFGALLRRFRLAAGLSQEVLAERAAMSANGISALERGASKAPQRETLNLLVNALHLDATQQAALEQAAIRPSRPRRTGSDREYRHHDLPRALTTIYGRERDVAAAVALLEETQLVTMTGSGGVGKTRLALEVARASLDAFPDGVRFVDLAPMRDQEAVASAVAAHFGLKPAAGISPIEQLTSSLECKRALLIIDNCEHLISAVALLSQTLIAGCPELCIIATSRQSLNVPGEYLYRVASLERESSVKLFLDRAKRALWSFTASEEGLELIARIVQRLDGIALAIELAAARVTVLTPDEIEARLSERFHVLSGGSSLALPRHQTMRTALQWSYDLLSAEEQKIFRRLWVFPDSFSIDAAVAVCREQQIDESRVFEVLTSLVDKSLVVSFPFEKTQRYRLLETMRAYAAELFEDFDEIKRLQCVHAEYYAALAERMERALASAESTTAWARSLEPETENFRSALDWALTDRGDDVVGVRILSHLQEFWTSQGLTMEASRRAQATLDRDPEMPHALRASLWLTLARMHQGLWVHPQATLEAARRAREHYEQANDPGGLALAIRQEAAAQMRLGAYPESRENFERSIALYRELGDQRMVVRGLGYLASLFQVQQDYALACATLLDVLEMVQESGDDRMIPTVAMNLAETEFALGECERAVQRARENLTHVEMRKSVEMRSTQEANLSAYLFALGRIDEAREMALDSAHDAVKSFVAVPLQHLAAIGAATNPQWAATLLGYVENVFEATGFNREYTERYTYDRLVATLNERLDECEFDECLREGAAMSEKQARRAAGGH